MTLLTRHLRSIGACQAGFEVVGNRSPQDAWDLATHPGMLLWWASNTPVNSKEKIAETLKALGVSGYPVEVVDTAACDTIRGILVCPYAEAKP